MSAFDNHVPLSATILAEARELLSALRRNRRFGYLLPFTAAATQPAEHPLVKELKTLRDIIRIPVTATPTNQQLNTTQTVPASLLIPADALLNALEPFFEVVRSRDASGIITGVALQSLCRISARLIHLAQQSESLPNYATVLGSIVDAAAACRFDATDPASDEVVLARITRVISSVCTSCAAPLLSDAAMLRAIEACLGIASGRRRASDLLKRSADVVLVDIFQIIGLNLETIASSSSSNSLLNQQQQHHKPEHSISTADSEGKETEKISYSTALADESIRSFPSIFATGGATSAFGYTLDSDAFSQHGPASLALIVAVLQLVSRMADPYYAQSLSERALGLQLLSTVIGAAGPSLKSYLPVKRILMRDCARGLLRSLGLFKSQPSIISYTFTISIQLVHSLKEDIAPFLLALLERVFPYYISGYENVLPKTGSSTSDINGETSNSNQAAGAGGKTGQNGTGANANGTSSANDKGNDENGGSPVELDPVIREIGLEALADLLSIPGLLCVVYRLSDCDMSRPDVVEPFLRTLGHGAKLNGLRRRSKRLRASTSGTNRVAGSGEAESDEEDNSLISGSKGSPEASRFGRSAALLCADSILAVIDTISDRFKLETAGLAKPPFLDEKAFEASKKVRGDKVRLQTAAAAFNASEKVRQSSKLLILLREHGLVDTKKEADGTVQEDLEDDIRAIVRFIRETPGLVKEKIGDILGEPDNLSRKVLADYTETFDFEGRQFTESLRVYLESFRLPGEAQKIDRIVESFANRYFAQNNPKNEKNGRPNTLSQTPVQPETTSTNGLSTNDQESAHKNDGDIEGEDKNERNYSVLKSAEAAYVLSFSVVMLNTDQHNDSIKKKMTIEDFIKNCRGINDGEDLPKWFLGQVFDSIAAVEIRMSDEVGVGALTDLLWDEQLRKAGAFESKFPVASKSRIFDEQVFALSWEAGIVAANSILKEAGEPNSVQKALEGFLSVSRCATTYKLSRPTDAVISSLCNATTIREGPLYGAVIRFGTDIKAQMASVALSGVSRECGDWLRGDGWQALVAYLMRLHALCLLPSELEQKIGGFGSELVGVDKKPIDPSVLIPAWWPSRADNADISTEVKKPKKVPRSNNFFAAFLAASIGSEADNEEEEDDDDYDMIDGYVNGNLEKGRRRVSRSPPYYIRTRGREDTEARDLARKCIAGCRIEDVVINEAKVLQSTSLEFLCKAVAQSASRLMDSGEINEDEAEETEERLLKDDGAVLDWNDIAPRSTTGDSSIIVGINTNQGVSSRVETEGDYSSLTGSQYSWEGLTRERDERKAREFVMAFCIDVLCELTLQNRDRLHIPWPELHGLVVRIVAPATESLAVLERAVVALLRVGARLLHRDELRDDVLRGFNLLVRLPSDMAEALCVPVASGVYNIVKGHGTMIQSTSGWHAILSILENLARYDEKARQIGLDTIKWILLELNSGSVAVSSKTYAPLLDAILAYTSFSSVETSIGALEMLYLLSQRVSSFEDGKDENTNEEELWSEYWGPLFLGFASGVRDARGKVRNCALGVMERVIASRGSTEMLTAGQWYRVLSGVVLPLMTQLFATHGYFNATLEAEREAQRKIFEERNAGGTSGSSTADNNGVSRARGRSFNTSAEHEEQLIRSVSAACNRTRMRAMVLTSKTFLQHHIAIAAGLEEEEFTKLWMSVLEVFRVAVIESKGSMKNTEEHDRDNGEGADDTDDGVLIIGDGDDVTEHVPESVKNMLLVMCDCGLLKKSMPVRWKATFSLVREFIPDIEEMVCTATGQPSPSPAVKENGKNNENDEVADTDTSKVTQESSDRENVAENVNEPPTSNTSSVSVSS